MTLVKTHDFWFNKFGMIVKETGNLFPPEMIKDFSPRLLCPILNSIFDELAKLTPDSPPIFIPIVNLATEWINGFFDYTFSADDNGLIRWEIRDTTEFHNNKLIRLQPEMEQKLRDETISFLNSGDNCDIKE